MQLSSALDCYVEYQEFIEFYCNELQISQAWCVAKIWIESKGDPKAYRYEKKINDASYGALQILWGTAQWIRDKLGATYIDSPEQLYDVKINIEYGLRYFRYQLDRYDGCYQMAEAAYNSGSAWFVNDKHVKKVVKVVRELKENKKYKELHRRDE